MGSTPQPAAPSPSPATVDLRTHTLYEATIGSVSFGNVPQDVLRQTLASGRIASILLEQEISTIFGIESGTQGASPDHVSETLGRIQSKTYRSSGAKRFTRGPKAGQLKAAETNIWTTKSGFWDRSNRLTPEELEQAERYFDAYDHFMYVDISQMEDLRYSVVVLPTSEVVARKRGFHISESAIMAGVTRRVTLTAGGQVARTEDLELANL